MTKYSYEFKLQVVQEYQSGPLGYLSLAKKHGLPHHSPILNWVSQYRRQGRKGLKPKQSKTVYPFNFKLNVLRFKQETGASYRETADLFGLSNPSVIANWKRKFLEEGTQGLKKSIGRPPKMVKKSKKHKKKTSDDTTERLKELEAENEYLKTEVAYLKKLKALRAQKSLEQNNSQLSTNSDKKDSH